MAPRFHSRRLDLRPPQRGFPRVAAASLDEDSAAISPSHGRNFCSRYRQFNLDTNASLPYGFAQGKWKSQAPARSQRFPLWRYPMPLSLMTLSVVASPVTLQEDLKILERDDYCCQYCGLDGRASFENALVMSVDFVVPRAHKGKKDPRNLVACCRPCN